MFFSAKMRAEINTWQKEGLIPPETAQLLQSRYPVKNKSMTLTLSILGSILLGVGVILFFAANWGAISRFFKVIIILSAVLLSSGVGYYLGFVKKTYPKVGSALIILGSILYGAAIWLIGQIFNLPPSAGVGFFLWFIGVLPMAYLFHSLIILFLAMANLTAWFLVMELPLGLPLFFFPIFLGLIALPLILNKKDKFNFTMFIFAVFLWFLFLGYRLTEFNFYLVWISFLLFGLALYFYSVISHHPKMFFTKQVAAFLAVLSLYIGLLPFTFETFYPLLPFKYFLLYLLPLTFFIYGKYQTQKTDYRDLPLFFLFLPFLIPYGEPVLLAIINLVLFAFTLFVIYHGYQEKNPFLFNLGVVLFALSVIIKYFDFFFGLMPRSLFFISGGIILLCGSLYLEKKRRNFIETIKGVETDVV